MMKEIKYLSGVIIHQVLLNGKYSRTIPKEDISALKQIEESLKTAQEKKLDLLVAAEKEKLQSKSKAFANKNPSQIIWS